MTAHVLDFRPVETWQQAFDQLAWMRRDALRLEEQRRLKGMALNPAWLAYLDAREAYLHAALEATSSGTDLPTPPVPPEPPELASSVAQ